MAEGSEKTEKRVLVVGGDPGIDWAGLFRGSTLSDGTAVSAVFSPWESLSTVAYSDGCGCIATVPGGIGSFKPDAVLIRGACHGAWGTDHKNTLLSFAFGGALCVNSVQSLLLAQDKPLIHAALQAVRKRLGKENFPLLDQTFYPSFRSMTFVDGSFPLIAKLGTVHAGLGKMKLADMQGFHDLRSVLAITPHYMTTEPYVDWMGEGGYDWRLQKIGPHVRGFRRTSDTWKGASMASRDADQPVDERQRMWLDEVSAALGMDVLSIDGVHSRDGKDAILEVNDSAIGLNVRHMEEDLGHMKELVLTKMEADAVVKKQHPTSVTAAPSVAGDPMAMALEQARAELAALRARVAELEKKPEPQPKSGISKLFSR